MNVKNRTLFIADNLYIMQGIDSETVDLIYLDPPFNTNKRYKAPIGSPAEGASFKDIWTDEDVKDGWYSEIAEQYPHIHRIIQASEQTYDNSMMIYLMAMCIRLIEMQRILKPTGSIYLHCDPTASHYLKTIMDDIFGKNNFKREIIWNIAVLSGFKTKAKNYVRGHDTLLFYVKSKDYIWNSPRQAHRKEYLDRFNKTDENGRKYFDGRGKQRYLDEVIISGKAVGDVWSDVMSFQQTPTSKEKTGYPTQKPLKLLERLIKASSNEGDVVLDPFCGCATACVAAEKLQRQWIGIDISPDAEDITKYRLDEASEQGALFSPIEMSDVTVTSEPPIRTDTDPQAPQQMKLPNYTVHKNFLYGEQEGFCNGCREHFRIRNLTVDHIVPQSKDGTDHPKNLQLLCHTCNSTKGSGTQEELIKRLKAQGIL